MGEDGARQVEIAVRHVTMEFRRAKQEAGSLKEWMVRALKGGAPIRAI